MTVCVMCGRSGSRGFVVANARRTHNEPGDDAGTEWRCTNSAACERRQRAIERSSPYWDAN